VISTPDSRIVRLLGLMVLGTLASPLIADETADKQAADTTRIKKREPTRFLRVRYDEFKTPVTMQTATAKYVLKRPEGQPPVEVFLESVIHVGDRTYYRGFNRRFRRYDVVLYEYIAPPEKQVPDPEQVSPSPIRLLQQVAADGLGFAHQIDEIDYKAQNLVHSDLSPAELDNVTKDRGDDGFTMMVDMLLDTMRRVNRDRNSLDKSPAQEKTLDLSVLSDPDGAVKIRRLLANGFGTNISLETVLRPAQIATLIRARNDRAMEVLQQQLDADKRQIALFWGAGHMQDFERQLILDYGFEPAGVVWRDAWDLREGAVERAPLEAILENSLRGKLQNAVRQLLKSTKPEE
jgi:hypothetical protein